MENIAGLGLLHAGIKNWETASILHLGIIFSIILKQDKGTGRFLISCLLGSCPTEGEEEKLSVCVCSLNKLFPEGHKEIWI